MSAHIIIGRDERIACPKCCHSFAISEGLSRQTIDRYAQDFEHALARRARDQEAQLAAEAKRRAEKEAAAQVASLKDELSATQARLATSKEQIDKARQEAAALAREVAENEIRGLRDAIASRQALLEGLRAAELDLRRQLNEAEDGRRNQEVEYQRRLDDERKHIEERAHATIAEEFQRREAQMKALIESSQREVADLKRKLEQGSQQAQGEAFELTLEAMLRAAFPFDEIVPVPKGVNGADLLQRVRSASGQVCGTIVWESKETKNWQPAWIAKLKDDQHAVGAELAVLVTAAMPKEAREPFIREADVWVTRIEAARPLAEVLRTTLLEVHKLRQANTGRHEKMERLYACVHSPQFAQRMQAIGEAFAAMKADLDAEKAAMMRIWKKREAQITRVTGGLMHVVGELQGVSEEALPELEAVGALAGPEEDGVLGEAAAA